MRPTSVVRTTERAGSSLLPAEYLPKIVAAGALVAGTECAYQIRLPAVDVRAPPAPPVAAALPQTPQGNRVRQRNSFM